jgi:hypothetical protein
MKLELQINKQALNEKHRNLENFGIMVTPPINEDFWLLRVPVSENQAIVGFPKFGVIGIGFQVERNDWNVNLPSGVDAIELYNHIKKNKGDPKISKLICLEAILMIQNAILKMQREEAIQSIKKATTQPEKVAAVKTFLRISGNYEVAEALDGHCF